MGTLSSSALAGTKVGVLSGLALTDSDRSFCAQQVNQSIKHTLESWAQQVNQSIKHTLESWAQQVNQSILENISLGMGACGRDESRAPVGEMSHGRL
jgi:hypothetical protein